MTGQRQSGEADVLTGRRVLLVVGVTADLVAFAWLLAEGLVIVGVAVLAAGLLVPFGLLVRELVRQFRVRENAEEKTLTEPWSTGELAVLSGGEPPLLAGTGAVPQLEVEVCAEVRSEVPVVAVESQVDGAGPAGFTGRWAEMFAKFRRDTEFELARIADVMGAGGALS